MAVRFFVFAQNQKVIEDSIGATNWSMLREFGRDARFDEDTPSNNPWEFVLPDGETIELGDGESRGYGLSLIGGEEPVEKFFEALREIGPEAAQIAGTEIEATTLTVAPNWQHWCSGAGFGNHVATRRQAEILIGAQSLRDHALTGAGTHVLVVDQGLNRRYVESLGGVYGGGFRLKVDDELRIPGEADRPYVKMQREHGAMMLRSLLALAPDAVVYDLPMIPYNIADISAFTLKAAFSIFLASLLPAAISGPWIAVNAWGIDDRFREQFPGDYTNRPSHPLNIAYRYLADVQDVVFAAGNSGQFCPDPEAGPYDRGPGRSIWGANGLNNVTCVGAVTARGEWIGTSSQGPGPSRLSGDHPNRKPDLCAPSWFVEDGDARLRSGGTSAATAMTGGVIAALRQKWRDASPEVMRAALRHGARKTWHTSWNGRMGEGILNVPGAIDRLPVEHEKGAGMPKSERAAA